VTADSSRRPESHDSDGGKHTGDDESMGLAVDTQGPHNTAGVFYPLCFTYYTRDSFPTGRGRPLSVVAYQHE
jgi:hypothetical protein